MAYNPFDFFRRNQKTAFAALTIFVMFTFVLSFGSGDFFQWLPGWLRSLRSGGKDVMATIDGKKLYDADLAQLDENRGIADQFMQMASGSVSMKIVDELKEETPKSSEQLKQALQSVTMAHSLLGNPQFGEQGVQFAMQQFQRAEPTLRFMLGNPELKDDEKNSIVKARKLIELDSRMLQTGRMGYFVNLPRGKTNQDRFEFALWLKKADKLGIRLQPSDAETMAKDEFSGLLTKDLWTSIEKTFQGKAGFSRQQMLTALADEFRVRTAMNIVLGQGPTFNRMSSPAEMYQTYKQLCDQGMYAMMAVPAENFMDKVTGTPTEAELRELFDKYRSQEPDPTRETPGFREPRKLKMTWVEISGDEPGFKKIGDEVFKISDVSARLAPLSFGTMSPLTTSTIATLADPTLQSAYKNYVTAFGYSIYDKWSPWSKTDDRLIDTSVMRHVNLGAAVGSFIGSRLTNAHPIAAVLNVKETAAQFERNDRARVLVALLAPGTAAGSNILGSSLIAGATMPRPLPLSVVKTQLEVEEKAKVTRTQVEKEIEAFVKELTRLGAKKDKSEARSYADKYIAEHGLKTGSSTDFRDMYSIDEDPGLSTLAEKKQRGHGANDAIVRMGPKFFDVERGGGRSPSTISFFEPRPYPQDDSRDSSFRLRPGEASYLTWRAESVEPSTPRELKDIRAKVEATWKRTKAREMAKLAAEELRRKIDERIKAENASDQMGKVDAIARETHDQFVGEKHGNNIDAILRSKYFLLDRIAPLLVQDSITMQGANEQATPFGAQNVIRKELQYPTVPMLRELLETKDKTLGTTTLQPDLSKDIYYVGVLLNRKRQTTLDFREKNLAEAMTPLGQMLQREQQSLSTTKSYESTLALLKAEFKVANEHEKLKQKAESTD